MSCPDVFLILKGNQRLRFIHLRRVLRDFLPDSLPASLSRASNPILSGVARLTIVCLPL